MGWAHELFVAHFGVAIIIGPIQNQSLLVPSRCHVMWGIGGEGFCFSFLGYRRGIARVSPETRELSCLVLSCCCCRYCCCCCCCCYCLACLDRLGLHPGLEPSPRAAPGTGNLFVCLHLYFWLVAWLWLSLWWNLRPIVFFKKMIENN